MQGGFGGTINLTKGNRFEMIVLEDGTFWTMYGNATNGVVDVVGFIEGTSTQDTQAHTFASGDSHDFGLTPVAATTLAGAYSAKSISGTIAYSASSQPTFSGSPIPTHQYDYDAAATVADAQGSWAMVSLTGVQTTLNVASDGTFVGSDVGGCSLGGSLVPRASGKNVFDLALQFGATCPKGATAYNGIALLTHVSGGSQLVLAAIDEAHGSGVAATGLPVR